MPQVSEYVSAPYQGVSQAAAQVRLDGQCEALEDTLVSIPQGATKRPPFEWVGVLGGHPGSTSGLFERIERAGDLDSLLTLTLEGGVAVPRVYLLTDTTLLMPAAITIGSTAQTYLNTALTNPAVDLNALTVEDYTFIVNRSKVVANVGTSAPPRAKEAMVWVRQAAYARTFSVTVTPAGGSPVTSLLTTPNGTNVTDGNYVGTDVIAQALIDGTYPSAVDGSVAPATPLNTLTGFTIQQIGPVIYFTHPTLDFTVTVKDDLGGVALTAIKDTVQSFSDLPKVAKSGFTVRVTQTSGSPNDDFFVKFILSAGEGTGTWQETIAPGSNLGLDPNTMPVGLFNNGTWNLTVLGWKPRSVGDPVLAPDPDFIGQTIQDISFWRNRLALISGEGVTLSSSADPFQLYPITLASVLASDSIALLSPFPSRTTFRYGVNFDRSLVVFGDIAQAEVTADGVATPATTKIDVLTTFEFSQNARPQSSNGKVYFVAPNGKRFSKVFEMKVNNITAVTDGEDMTVAVPRYVPIAIDRVASCPVNYIIAYAQSGSTMMAVHLFRYSDNARVQNGWMRWHLPAGYTLGGCWFFNTQMYALFCRNGVGHLVKLDTAPDLLDDDSDRNLTCLDMRLDESQVGISYDAGSDRTTLTLPYPADASLRVAVRAPGGMGGPLVSLGELPEGYLAEIVSQGGSAVVLRGDYQTVPFFVGYAYRSSYIPSTIYPKLADQQPIISGRVGIRYLHVSVGATGYLRAEVTAKGRPTRITEFTGFSVDDSSTPTDVAPSLEGTFSVPVLTNATQAKIEFVNDSHLRSAILGFEWVAELNQKSQRL